MVSLIWPPTASLAVTLSVTKLSQAAVPLTGHLMRNLPPENEPALALEA
jgi:hypothetical protein